MSGPKTSVYEMTPEQRRVFQEQQKIIRETIIAKSKLDSLIHEAKTNLESMDKEINELKIICSESGTGRDELNEFTLTYNNFSSRINSIYFSKSTLTLDQLNQRISEMRDLSSHISIHRRKFNDSKNKISNEFKCVLTDMIVDSMELSFKGLGKSRKETVHNKTIIKINTALKKIDKFSLSKELLEKLKRIKKSSDEITNAAFLENFCSTVVYPFVHECEFYSKNITEYNDLLVQYQYLAEQTGDDIEKVSCSRDGLDFLRLKIEQLEKVLDEQKEREYICLTVDEVMKEMGYELIGERSVSKTNGHKFRSGLYSFESGTAVNVTFSDSGQISMEIGALDNCDRLPDAAEVADLLDDMQSFCYDYFELEKRLKEKGIKSSRISLLPPDEKYAKVINTSLYELRKQPELLNRRRNKTNKKIKHGER